MRGQFCRLDFYQVGFHVLYNAVADFGRQLIDNRGVDRSRGGKRPAVCSFALDNVDNAVRQLFHDPPVVLVFDPSPFGAPERWLIVALAGCALLLDGADGWAARRQRLASAFGARFDMEVDALAILVLAAVVFKAAAAPFWVLAIGAMRYFYLAAGQACPWLRRPLPCRRFADRRRKTIAVIQSVALLISLAPATPASWAAAACGTALALLAYSFAADIFMLSARPHR